MLESKETKAKIENTLNDPFYGLSFKVGVAENKNTLYRNKMEDVHTYIANFAERVDWGYFAIFDGHAGKDTARWCGNHLHRLLEEEIEKDLAKKPEIDQQTGQENDQLTENNDRKKSDDDNTVPLIGESDLQEKLYNSFVKADELIEKEGTGSSGCTAVVAVLRWETDGEAKEAVSQLKSPLEENKQLDVNSTSTNITSGESTAKIIPSGDSTSKTLTPNNTSSTESSAVDDSKIPTTTKSKFDFEPASYHKRMLYTSNVGDLRIVLYRNGQPFRLTYDHKATDVNEINRVRDSGGLIMKNRVNGVLAVTRSLGDSYMKDLVIGKPFTTVTEITKEDEFMILACDGVWDVISDMKACEFVADIIRKGGETQVAAKKLCQFAIDNSTTDNVTVMIVKFDNEIFG